MWKTCVATMPFSLPELMLNWVQTQIESGQYASASDYVRDLNLRDKQKHEQIAALQESITMGQESQEQNAAGCVLRICKHFY